MSARDGHEGKDDKKRKRRGLVKAPDGQWARRNGAYAEHKLSFLDRFGPPALKVTERKWQRIYVDLFAGPGLNMDTGTGRFFEGAALRVLQMTAPRDSRLSFTDAILVNKNKRQHLALETRISALREQQGVPTGRARDGSVRVSRVQTVHGDANVQGPAILRDLQSRYGRSAYALVFADTDCPSNLPWSTLDAIGREGPRSTDLYVLMPLDMGINRMLPYEHDRLVPNAEALTTYYGTEAWRPIVHRHATDAQRPKLRAAMLDLYVRQLQQQWPLVEMSREICKAGSQRMYRMLFCTRDETAAKIARWESGSVVSNHQLGLGIA